MCGLVIMKESMSAHDSPSTPIFHSGILLTHALGFWLGNADGRMLVEGSSEGPEDGRDDGLVVGSLVGCPLGLVDGDIDGIRDGRTLGDSDGWSLGIDDG